MKVEKVCEDRFRVWLSEEELVGWGVRYDTLQRGTPSTDRLIRQILRRVRREHGGWDRCVVEALPLDDGCLMLLTLHTTPQPLVCRVRDEHALFTLAQQLVAAAPCPPNALYSLPWGYIVVLQATPALTPRHRRLAAEYADVTSGQAAVAAAAEYGRLLAADHAVERLTERVPSAPARQDRPH